MILFLIAFIFAVIGALFLLVNFLSDDVTDTKGWGIFFIIAAAAACLLKYYLANPGPVNDFFRSLMAAK